MSYVKACLAKVGLLGLVMAIMGSAFVAFVGYAVVADVPAEKSNLIAASASAFAAVCSAVAAFRANNFQERLNAVDVRVDAFYEKSAEPLDNEPQVEIFVDVINLSRRPIAIVEVRALAVGRLLGGISYLYPTANAAELRSGPKTLLESDSARFRLPAGSTVEVNVVLADSQVFKASVREKA